MFSFNENATSGSLYSSDYCHKECQSLRTMTYGAEMLMAVLLLLGLVLLLKHLVRAATSPLQRGGLTLLVVATMLIGTLIAHWSFTETPLVYVQGEHSVTRDMSIAKPTSTPMGMEWKDVPLRNGWALYETKCLSLLPRSGLPTDLKRLATCQKDFVSNSKETFDANIRGSFDSFLAFQPYQKWFHTLLVLIAIGIFMLFGFADNLRKWILQKSL